MFAYFQKHRFKLFEADRLYQIAVESHFLGARFVVRHAVAGQSNKDSLCKEGIGAKTLGYRVTVLLGKPHVEKNDIRLECVGFLYRFLPVICHENLMMKVARKSVRQKVGKLFIILREKNF